MLADVMPNILAHAPFESVFGLACSCRALSRTTVERAQYEIETPIALDGDFACKLTRYPNGWRLRMRAAGDSIHPFTLHIAYTNNMPWVLFATGGHDVIPVMSLDTGIHCQLQGARICIAGRLPLPPISVTNDRVVFDESVDDRIAEKIAAALRPLPVYPDVDIDRVVTTFIDAADIYARHIGNSRAISMPLGATFDSIVCERSQWN